MKKAKPQAHACGFTLQFLFHVCNSKSGVWKL